MSLTQMPPPPPPLPPSLSPSLPPSLPQSSGDEMDEFEVELCKQEGHGLGITIAGLVSEDTGGQSAILHLWYMYTVLCSR